MPDGGCYCGALRYRAGGEPMLRAQCHCRECQYHSGGGPNYFMVMPAGDFIWTEGAPRIYRRDPVNMPVSRDFCGTCGTHIASRIEGRPLVILKIGTLDDPAAYGAPAMAIYACDRQPFHLVPDGLPVHDKGVPR